MSRALATERTQTDDVPTSLLAPDEPQPSTVTNEGGRSPFLIVAGYAGKIFASGVSKCSAFSKQIASVTFAWDIGAGAVSWLAGLRINSPKPPVHLHAWRRPPGPLDHFDHCPVRTGRDTADLK
jgi:hypothetical protein